jgi:hypothetical protein
MTRSRVSSFLDGVNKVINEMTRSRVSSFLDGVNEVTNEMTRSRVSCYPPSRYRHKQAFHGIAKAAWFTALMHQLAAAGQLAAPNQQAA